MIDKEELGAKIRQKQYQWTAGRTSLSELTLEDQKKRLGLKVEATDLQRVTLEIQQARKAFTFPGSWDWRSADGGKDWTTPIRDQLDCGACVSFATAAVMESMEKIQTKDPLLSVDLSEAHLFSCGCGNCCETGWSFQPALEYARTVGVTDEKCFPYRRTDQPCGGRCSDWEKRVTKITEWEKITNVAERKSVLSTVGPMIAGMAVYQDFYSYTSGIYRHVAGALMGYHAVAVVGYSEAEQAWICKNQWGSGWGDKGWFKIGYGECAMDTGFAMYSIKGVIPSKIKPDCLIATAAYGSPLSPEVQFLRDVRDNVIRRTERGTLLMNEAERIYYLFSPQVVRDMKRSPGFRKVVRSVFVVPLVHSLYAIFKISIRDNGNTGDSNRQEDALHGSTKPQGALIDERP